MAPANTTAAATLRLERRFAAPRQKVFEAWTRPEALKEWFCHPGYRTVAAEADARPGGRYLIRMLKDGETEPFHVEGVYKEVSPPGRLVFTWTWSNIPGFTETKVTVSLQEEDGGTRLLLTHERFASEAFRDEHGAGWDLVLQALARHLA